MEKVDMNTEEPKKEKEKEDIFSVQEITIEEMAIDGICGVY
jgi:mycofactocin precursor